MVLAAAIGALGSLAGSALSGAFANSQQSNSYSYNLGLQKNQYKLSQKGLVEQYSNARQGLENAGYNPILAATNGINQTANIGAGGVGSGGSLSDLGIGEGMTNAYQTFKLNKQSVNNQSLTAISSADNANAQAELYREQAITEQAKRTQMEFQNAMYDVEKHLKEKELSWADRKFYSEIYDNMQRAENYGAMASIARYNAETERRNSQTNAMNANTAILNANTNARSVDLEAKNRPWAIAGQIAGGIGALGAGFGLGALGRKAITKNVTGKVVKTSPRSYSNIHTFGRNFGTRVRK